MVNDPQFSQTNQPRQTFYLQVKQKIKICNEKSNSFQFQKKSCFLFLVAKLTVARSFV